VSYGKKQRSLTDYPAQGFHWMVPFVAGKNHIRAVSGRLTDEITCDYQTAKWGAPAQIKLTCQDGLVTAQICDQDGVPCLDSKDWVEFSMVGDGLMHQNEGTNTGSYRIQAANGKAAIRVDIKGKTIVFARLSNTSLITKQLVLCSKTIHFTR
jgi:beta-galactosidase